MPSSPFDHYALGGETDSAGSASTLSASKSSPSSPCLHPRSLLPSAHSHSHTPNMQPLHPFTPLRGSAAASTADDSYSTAASHSASASYHSPLDPHCDTSSDASSLSIPLSLSNSTSGSAASTTSAGSSSNSSPPTSVGRERLVRVKDKLKHSESENRRRTRLRHKFSLLRDASLCSKKDRYTILSTACARINELHSRLQQVEHDKASLLLSINNISQQQQQQQQQHSAERQQVPPSSLPSLSSYPLLSSVCAALVSVDGRVLDCNGALCAAVGADRDEVTRHTMFALCDSEQLLDSVLVMKRLIEGHSDNWEMRRTLLHRAGHSTDMQCTLACVRHEGRLAAFLLLMVPAVQQQPQPSAAALSELQHGGSKSHGWPQQSPGEGEYGEAEFVKREDALPDATATDGHFQAAFAHNDAYGERQAYGANNTAPLHSPFVAPVQPHPSLSPYPRAHVLPAAAGDDSASSSVLAIKQEAEALSASGGHSPHTAHTTPHRTKRPHPYLSPQQLHSHERPTAVALPLGYDGAANSPSTGSTLSSMLPPRALPASHGGSQPSLSRRLPPSMTVATSGQQQQQQPQQQHTRHLSTHSPQLLPLHGGMQLSHSLSAGASEPRSWSRPSLSAPNSPSHRSSHARQAQQHGDQQPQYNHSSHHTQHQQQQQQQAHYDTDLFHASNNAQSQWLTASEAGAGSHSGGGEHESVQGGLEPLHHSFGSYMSMHS